MLGRFLFCSLLLDNKGYLKIVDFGFAKQMEADELAYTLCGTPDYLVRDPNDVRLSDYVR